MEDPERARVLQPSPERLALIGPVPRSTRKEELPIAERFHGGRGAGARKGLEEGADRLPDLLIP
jgi:hypothetical protein